MSQPLKDHEAFFRHVEEGLQAYFDNHDKYWGGILHLTVGVKTGKVGGIIKSADAFGASVATTEGLSSQRSLPPPRLSYEGFTLSRVEEILKYVLPKYMPRTDVRYALDEVISELRNDAEPPQPAEPPRKRGRPKKQQAVDSQEPQSTEPQITEPQNTESL